MNRVIERNKDTGIKRDRDRHEEREADEWSKREFKIERDTRQTNSTKG